MIGKRNGGVVRSCVVILVMFGCHTGSCVPRTAFAAPSSADVADDELVIQAEAKREISAHAEAAALFARAYRDAPGAQQASLMGEILVRNARADYVLALQQVNGSERSSERLLLLSEQRELLREFMVARASDAVPLDIARACAEVELELNELEQRRAGLEAVVPPPPVLDPMQEVPHPTPKNDPVESAWLNEEPTHDTDDERIPASRRRITAALLGVGAVSIAGGAAMLVGGGWMLSETSVRRTAYVDTANAQIATTELDSARRDVDQQLLDDHRASLTLFEQRSRGNATALLVIGSALVGSGIGLGTWALVRARRDRPRATPRASVAPTIAPRHIGVRLGVVF